MERDKIFKLSIGKLQARGYAVHVTRGDEVEVFAARNGKERIKNAKAEGTPISNFDYMTGQYIQKVRHAEIGNLIKSLACKYFENEKAQTNFINFLGNHFTKIFDMDIQVGRLLSKCGGRPSFIQWYLLSLEQFVFSPWESEVMRDNGVSYYSLSVSRLTQDHITFLPDRKIPKEHSLPCLIKGALSNLCKTKVLKSAINWDLPYNPNAYYARAFFDDLAGGSQMEDWKSLIDPTKGTYNIIFPSNEEADFWMSGCD